VRRREAEEKKDADARRIQIIRFKKEYNNVDITSNK
jgi:hypothetical protein